MLCNNPAIITDKSVTTRVTKLRGNPWLLHANMRVSLMTNQWQGNLEMTNQRPEIKLVR